TAASHALELGQMGVAGFAPQMGPTGGNGDLPARVIPPFRPQPRPGIDIPLTGNRAGERLPKILFARGEPTAPSGIEGIGAAKPVSPSVETMRGWLAALEQGLAREDRSVIFGVLHDAVPDFGGEAA